MSAPTARRTLVIDPGCDAEMVEDPAGEYVEIEQIRDAVWDLFDAWQSAEISVGQDHDVTASDRHAREAERDTWQRHLEAMIGAREAGQ